MKTGIILQARCNSKRFPKKVLKKINNKSILELVIERLKNIKNLSLIVATTTSKDDDEIYKISKKNGVLCFRGKTNDVLSRYYEAANKYELNIIIRCTADCPFIDRKILNKMLKKYLNNKYDYFSNILEPSFPSGLHVEILNFKTLKIAYKEAIKKSDREHVTPYIYRKRNKFKIGSFKQKINQSFHRWTIDYKEDLKFVKKVYKEFNYKNSFQMKDILRLLKKKPEIMNINYFLKKKQNLL